MQRTSWNETSPRYSKLLIHCGKLIVPAKFQLS